MVDFNSILLGGETKTLEQETFDRLVKLEKAFNRLLQLFSRPIQQDIEDILNDEKADEK